MVKGYGESHILSAAGSTWNNVTVSVAQPLKHKHCLSLKLNKKAKKED